MALEELGSRFPPYLPTYRFAGNAISATHRKLAHASPHDGLIELKDGHGVRVVGWLRPEDARKLYEMAYYAPGDILELGAYHGLSTLILAQAAQDALQQKNVFSVDIDPTALYWADVNLRSLKRRGHVSFVCENAVTFVQTMAQIGKRFSFVFVDHSHAYQLVADVCRELKHIVTPGGFCLFHDFNDIRNRDDADADYGVYQAVVAELLPSSFEFYGIYGCTALYRRNPPAAPTVTYAGFGRRRG